MPYQLVHTRVEARVTSATVEVFVQGRRVASHACLTGRGRYATDVAHMPRAHRAHAEWTPSRLIGWAEQTGPPTGRLVAGILERLGDGSYGRLLAFHEFLIDHHDVDDEAWVGPSTP